MSENCIFCQIIDGELPSTKIYEDEDTYAFLDASPVNMGHTLVVPKEHYRNVLDTPEELVCKVATTAKRLAPAVMEGMDADGVNITNNNEAAAFQDVFHYHVHVIPRHEDDGYEPWQGERDYREREKQEIKKKVATELSS